MKKKILLSASLFHALTDAASVITPMVFPLLLSQNLLIANYSQIGLLSNLGLLTSLVVQFLVVRISFRSEYRTLMILSGLGLCASMAVIPFARTYAGLVLFFLLLRVFTSLYHPLVIAWISKSRAGSGQELDDAMGIQSGSGNLGVGLAFHGAELGRHSIRGPFRPRPGRLGAWLSGLGPSDSGLPPAALVELTRSIKGSSRALFRRGRLVGGRAMPPLSSGTRDPLGQAGRHQPCGSPRDHHRPSYGSRPPVQPKGLHSQPRQRRGALPARLRPTEPWPSQALPSAVPPH
jgi:MFS family permease